MPVRMLKKDEDTNREKGLKKSKMLVGGQAKLDKNKNNKIDAEDFKILKREKAKGRGQGLQDEKMKPGKVKPVKAVLGIATMGLLGDKMLKDKNKKAMAVPGVGAAAAIAKKKKEILGKRMGGVMKARMGKKIRVKDDDSFDTKMKLQEKGVIDKKTGAGRERITKALKATKLGKIILPGVAAGVAAQQFLKSKMKKKPEQKPIQLGEKRKKMPGKMGGGMMQRPMGYASGTPKGGVPDTIFLKHEKGNPIPGKRKGPKRSRNSKGSVRQKQDFVGMRIGGSVTVKTKLGRNKPTKMY